MIKINTIIILAMLKISPRMTFYRKGLKYIFVFAICGVRSFAMSAENQNDELVKQALDLGCDRIVFAVDVLSEKHFYTSSGYVYKAYWDEKTRTCKFRENNSIRPQKCIGGSKLIIFSLCTSKETTILEDENGAIRDPYVHYNGKKIGRSCQNY